MTKAPLERECPGWPGGLSYTHLYGLDITDDDSDPQCESDREVVLAPRTRLIAGTLRLPEAGALVEESL